MEKGKYERFFDVVMAFQEFAGMPLRVTDAAPTFTDKELAAVEGFLLKAATYYQNEDNDKFPELVQLADKIRQRVGRAK